jgi:hypothetical protein
MPVASFARALVVAVALGLLAACVGSLPSGSGSGPAGGPATGVASRSLPASASKVYMAQRDGSSILAFAVDANGNIKPSVTIAGSKTLLTTPVALAIDTKGRIYAANDGFNQILIFAPGAKGNATPQVLGGSKTGLLHTDGIALDASGNIFVSNDSEGDGSDKILVYAAGSTGNKPPIRTISGSKTGLSEPVGMSFDAAGDLFVVNATSSTEPIAEFAPGAKGNIAPIATIGGAKTMIVEPFSVSLDSGGRIIVPSNGDEVLIFAKGSSGNVAPATIISGSNTDLAGVTSAGVDPSDEIFVTEDWVTSGKAVYVFASGASGNAAPIRSLAGAKTELDNPYYPSFH